MKKLIMGKTKMSKYYAVYKCAICNCLMRTTDNPIEIPKEELPTLLAKVIRNQSFIGNPYLYEAPMHIPHNCSNGDFGLAQFAGFKKM